MKDFMKKEREKKASLDKKELVSALNALLNQSITDSIHYITESIHSHGKPPLQNSTPIRVHLAHLTLNQQEKELAQLREKRNEEISIMDEQIKRVAVGGTGFWGR